MEVVAGLLLLVGSWFLGASSVEQESVQDTKVVSAEAKAVQPDSGLDSAKTYIRANGYYIKDLTVRDIPAEGCDLPVLTADLSAPSQGVRNVAEVPVYSCGG